MKFFCVSVIEIIYAVFLISKGGYIDGLVTFFLYCE